MSASTAPAGVQRLGTRRVPERTGRLRVLAAPAEAGRRMPFVGLCVALLLASLIAVLAVNIALSKGAYDVYVLEQRRTDLAEREQELSEQLAIESSPARLSERARALGMIPGTNPAFIRLSDGAILGSPEPADPATAPAVSAIATAADLAAARVAAEQAVTGQAAGQPAGAAPTGAAPDQDAVAAEQAAVAAAAAASAAAAAPPPPAVGDGAVPVVGTP